MRLIVSLLELVAAYGNLFLTARAKLGKRNTKFTEKLARELAFVSDWFFI